MEQWEIQRPLGRCAGTDTPFEPGQEFYAALVEIDGSFQRRDYSVEFWNEHHPQVFSYWKTHLPEPNQKKKLFVDDSVLVNFFERLAEETDPLKMNFRFVLALILMRKRILKYEATVRGSGQEVWQMRQTGSKQIHDVINPQLNEEQIQQVSNEISAILQGEV